MSSSVLSCGTADNKVPALVWLTFLQEETVTNQETTKNMSSSDKWYEEK